MSQNGAKTPTPCWGTQAWGPLWRAFCDPSNTPWDAASKSPPGRPQGATHEDVPWDGENTEATMIPVDAQTDAQNAMLRLQGRHTRHGNRKALAPRGRQTDVETSGEKHRLHAHVATLVVTTNTPTWPRLWSLQTQKLSTVHLVDTGMHCKGLKSNLTLGGSGSQGGFISINI